MPQLRLALAQVDPTLGELAGNAALIRDRAREAASAGAHLVAFGELALTGYPVEDLALRSSFVTGSRAAIDRLATDLAADGLAELPVVVGYVDRLEQPADPGDPLQPAEPRLGRPKGSPQNCAAVLFGGRVVARYAKHHLPNYGVFDEYRIFVPGQDLTVVTIRGMAVAIAICEDLWQDGGPVAATRRAGCDLLLVINASPYELAKDDARLALVTRRARQAGCPLAFVNLVGGQDELIFDGGSLVVDAAGRLLARAEQFTEQLLVADLDLGAPAAGPGESARQDPNHQRPEVDADPDEDDPDPVRIQRVTISEEPVPSYPAEPATLVEPLSDDAEVYHGLVLALRDYVRKNGFRSVLLGLSGGIDSALVAAIGCDAIGAENVFGVSMPSVHSSEHSRDDAADLAKRTGLDYRVVSIAPVVNAFQESLGLTGVAAENLQARVRGVILMGIANQEGHLTLTTGNKSELAVGYSTIYGDAVGGFGPVKDVPKTRIWSLARWRNAEAARLGQVPPIPENSISKPPSAELAPGQVDQDSLPPYDLLDAVLEAYVGGAQGRSELLTAGFDADVVDRVVTLVDRAEWKRRQYPPGPKISALAFGRDRRLPITSHWREHRS